MGDYLPRKCGIATFTHDLRDAVSARNPDTECFVVPVSDNLSPEKSSSPGPYKTGDFVAFSLPRG